MSTTNRDRGDRCPGALRPWLADDGLLVRLRLVGGRIASAHLLALLTIAERFGDGHLHLTSRANLQLRALPADGLGLRADVLAAIEAAGLLPSRTHDLVRNVMVSPQTGLAGGRTDLRPVAEALDQAILADPRLGSLPGRLLFVLDDGRGDLLERACDHGLVAHDDVDGQLRIGDFHGPVLALADAAACLVRMAGRFLDLRGSGSAAPWHVRELTDELAPAYEPDTRLPAPAGPLSYGEVAGGRHVDIPDGLLDRALVEALTAAADTLIVTPWHGVLVPEEAR